MAHCPGCGGTLKPDFVFFGENVPKDRVERSYAMVDAAGALLVAGSSLTVMSGLRFVRNAAKDGSPSSSSTGAKPAGTSLPPSSSRPASARRSGGSLPNFPPL